MDKQQTIETLRSAKKAHIKWRSYAQAIEMALDINANPVISTECEFGIWYYGDGQVLNHMQAYRDMEKPHQAVHDIYMKMYKEKIKKINVGLFGSKAKAEKEREVILEGLMQQMLIVSADLLEKLTILEDEILNMENFSKTKLDVKEDEKTESTIKTETRIKKPVKAKTSSIISDLSGLLD